MQSKLYLFRQLLILVAAIAVPLLALEGYNLQHSATQAREAAYRTIESYAADVAQDTEMWIGDTRQYLTFLAARPMILALDPLRCDPLLDGVAKRRRHVANVFVADMGGRGVCFSVKGPGQIPETLQSFEWFRDAAASNALIVSKPFLAPVVQRMVAAVSQPLRDATGTRIGTVTLLLDLDSLQRGWSRYDLPANSRISLLDSKGIFVAATPDFMALVGKDASAVIQRARALNANDIGVAPGIDGVERAFALRPVPTPRWEVAVSIPTSAVFGPYRAQLERSLVIMIGTALSTLSLAFFLARRMAAPLQGLVMTARAVRAGQMDCRAIEDVPGEFREVAREFNAMLDANDRHTDFYKALSQTNGAIVRMRSERELFHEICRICVDHGHASIAYVSTISGEWMTHVASAGPAQDFIAQLKTRVGDTSESGLSGLAAFSGERQICNDVAQDVRTTPWRAAGAKIGTQSIASCPFRRAGATVGALTLHMTVTGFFDARVIALLDEMTEDISFALDNFAREQSLLAREQQLAGLVDTAMDAIISIDSMYRVILFNRAASDMFGLSPSEAIGSSIQRFVPLRLQAAHAGYLAGFSRTGSTARRMGLHNLLALRPDGTEFPIEASISKLGEGDAVLMTVVIRDATEMRLAERAKHDRAVAETASRAKTEFLSRMSHELRTPLNAVLGFSQLLQTDPHEALTPGQRSHVEHIRLAGWHLLSLINDVLDITKIEGGHVVLDERRVDVFQSLDEAVLLNQAGAAEALIAIQASYRAGSNRHVVADPRRLRQVLINLLSNAIKYNHPGGKVELGLSGDEDETCIDVVDTSIGMDTSQLDHLYEPFNRLGREKNGVDGTGLGLSLTRQLVHLMGGRIDIKSATGAGTSVRVTLRTHGEQQPTIAPQVVERSSAVPSEEGSPSGTVLYIEDNAVNFMVVEALLLRWPGVTLLHAVTGVDGLAIAGTAALDLILLDMRLPDMGGLEVLRSLAAQPLRRPTPVVALSASAMPEDVEAALQAGALQYWTKPLEFDRFLSEMRSLLT